MNDNELFASLTEDQTNPELKAAQQKFYREFVPPPATNPGKTDMLCELLQLVAQLPPDTGAQVDIQLAGLDHPSNLTTTAEAVLNGESSLEQLDRLNSGQYPTLESYLTGQAAPSRPFLSRVDFLKRLS